MPDLPDAQIFLDCGIVVILIIVGAFLAIRIRRWLMSEESSESQVAFTLGDLREMVRNGQMSSEEYERARIQIVAATQRAAEREAQAAKARNPSGSSASSSRDLARDRNPRLRDQ